MKAFKPVILIFIVLFIDQALKIWIKTNMFLGQEFNLIGDWFVIHFTENEGMAFGLELGGNYGKIILTLFRLFAVVLIGYYLVHLIKKSASTGLILSVSLIFAGAIGNIIDSVFYGVLFEDSINNIAEFLPEGGGYASLLHGRVVDMFYFPIFEGYLPEWVPLWGGDYFVFFRPVFNVADSAITVGVFFILLFQKRFFNEDFSAAGVQHQAVPEDASNTAVTSATDDRESQQGPTEQARAK